MNDLSQLEFYKPGCVFLTLRDIMIAIRQLQRLRYRYQATWTVNDRGRSGQPDMSPIKHIWDELGRRQPPSNVNELTNALINEWNNIPQQVILLSCIAAANGSYTRYKLRL